MTSVWKLSWEDKEYLFTSWDLAIRSLRLTYSKVPNIDIIDMGGGTIIVQSGDKRDWFTIVNGVVYDQVEHL